MSYEDLLTKIYNELPQLKGQLHTPHVVYVKPQGKVYITFQSDVLVEEAAFLKMERVLRQVFSQCPLALRVVSPSLAQDFLAHIENYKQVFVDFLKRNYPASISWMDQMDWRCDGERITLTFPDPFSLEFMGRQGVAARLVQAVKDSTESFVHDNVSQTPCPACGKLMLAVTGKKGRMLVCPDRECGHRQNVSMETNSRCPVCHKKLELFGDGDKQSYVCRCGFREKAEKFRERTGAGVGMSKRAVQQYLAKQEDAAPAVSAFALALQKAMEDKEK